jgi:hypothetical protein
MIPLKNSKEIWDSDSDTIPKKFERENFAKSLKLAVNSELLMSKGRRCLHVIHSTERGLGMKEKSGELHRNTSRVYKIKYYNTIYVKTDCQVYNTRDFCCQSPLHNIKGSHLKERQQVHTDNIMLEIGCIKCACILNYIKWSLQSTVGVKKLCIRFRSDTLSKEIISVFGRNSKVFYLNKNWNLKSLIIHVNALHENSKNMLLGSNILRQSPPILKHIGLNIFLNYSFVHCLKRLESAIQRNSWSLESLNLQFKATKQLTRSVKSLEVRNILKGPFPKLQKLTLDIPFSVQTFGMEDIDKCLKRLSDSKLSNIPHLWHLDLKMCGDGNVTAIKWNEIFTTAPALIRGLTELKCMTHNVSSVYGLRSLENMFNTLSSNCGCLEQFDLNLIGSQSLTSLHYDKLASVIERAIRLQDLKLKITSVKSQCKRGFQTLFKKVLQHPGLEEIEVDVLAMADIDLEFIDSLLDLLLYTPNTNRHVKLVLCKTLNLQLSQILVYIHDIVTSKKLSLRRLSIVFSDDESTLTLPVKVITKFLSLMPDLEHISVRVADGISGSVNEPDPAVLNTNIGNLFKIIGDCKTLIFSEVILPRSYTIPAQISNLIYSYLIRYTRTIRERRMVVEPRHSAFTFKECDSNIIMTPRVSLCPSGILMAKPIKFTIKDQNPNVDSTFNDKIIKYVYLNMYDIGALRATYKRDNIFISDPIKSSKLELN